MSRRRALLVALAAALPFLFFSVAAADGEAGLVIDSGEGDVETYCVPFEGDSIRGDELLEAAGVSIASVGGLVCALDGTGCPDAANTRDCLCECQGSECTYWAYFTQDYGESWVYSSLGFSGQGARDGGMQAWKWGPGGPSSAPAPGAITFEEVCGHPPQGGSGQPLPTPSRPGDTGSDGTGIPGEAIAFGLVALALVVAIAAISLRRRGIGPR